MMHLVEKGDPEESSFLQLAYEIWTQLNKHYPDHPWQVSFQGGAMIVRHAIINAEVSAALKREAEIKKWKRERKIKLVATQ